MKMSNKRIIEYDAVSETRTDDNLLMDSPAVGTRKITATNLIKPAMDAVSNEETERQNGDTNLDGKKYGDFVSTTNVTIDGTTYKTFWVIAPTSSNQVYGIANHPTNGRLFKIYNNQGTYSAIPYDKDTTKGDEISTKVTQTGSVQSSLTSTIAADTTLDNAIATLLNNDISIIDIIYPIGSYYETDDTTFDPNIAWGGTWILETEGLVHISSGTNYTVSTNAQDGGEATHKLTGAEMPSHGHQVRLYNTNGTQGTWKNYDSYGTTVVTNQYGLRNPFGGWTNSTTATAAQNGYGDQAGTTTQNGGNGAHNNMQPYKIVNRWHRTA